MDISSIQIGNRVRKDMGDLQALADSIAEVGLLHPVVVNTRNELVAGERRRAVKEKNGLPFSSPVPRAVYPGGGQNPGHTIMLLCHNASKNDADRF